MVYKHFFGRTPDGRAVTRFTLFNANSMEVNLTNLGAAVLSLHAPDKNGRVENIMSGCRSVEDFAAFRLGETSFDAGTSPESVPVWKWRTQEMDTLVAFCPESGEETADDEKMEVSFWLTNDDALVIHTTVTAAADRRLNPVCRLAFTLSGEENPAFAGHTLELNAVSGPQDFSVSTPIEQPISGEWLLAGSTDGENPLRPAAELTYPANGRKVTIYTTEPRIRLTALHSPGSPREMLGIETMRLPAEPLMLHAGETYESETVCRFGLIGDDAG